MPSADRLQLDLAGSANEAQEPHQAFLDDIRQNVTNQSSLATHDCIAQASDTPPTDAERRRVLEEVQRNLRALARDLEEFVSRSPERLAAFLNDRIQTATRMRANRADQNMIKILDDLIWRDIDHHKDRLPRTILSGAERYFRNNSNQNNPNLNRADFLRRYLREQRP